MDTLVLSTAYQPLAHVSWQQAMGMWASGRAEIIEEYDNRFVNTVNKNFKMPSVIRFIKNVFKRYNHKNIKFSRRNVFLRDRGKCQYCTKSLSEANFTLDHVVPVSKGGKKEWENIVTCCSFCNQKKRNRGPDEAGMSLMRRPVRPKTIPLKAVIYKVPKVWRHYVY